MIELLKKKKDAAEAASLDMRNEGGPADTK